MFDHLKTLVSTEACLKYYDTEAPTYLMVDASQRGLGAALLQPDRLQNGNYTVDTRPVAFASKSLSKSQQNYVNIEREMLAITFGIKRLHTYLYNRPSGAQRPGGYGGVYTPPIFLGQSVIFYFTR